MKVQIVTLLIFIQSIAIAQFDIEAYKEYLKTHKDMTFDELIKEFPAGYFLREAPTNLYEAEYGESISNKYKLTKYEKELISKHGFMVSERLTFNSFHNAFMDIFHKDMPVYISSDAVLFAVHHSFDKILKDIERWQITSSLIQSLDNARKYTSHLSVKSIDTVYQYAIMELDFYINMARNLLDFQFFRFYNEDSVLYKPQYVKNETRILETKELILNQQLVNNYTIFSRTPRPVDFSQFKPRGHYYSGSYLEFYFCTMMWLGRMEIYITSPEHQGEFPQQTDDDLKRQCILSALLAEVFEKSGSLNYINDIDELLNLFIGRQDNITIHEVLNVLKNLGNKDAVWVSQEDNWKIYQTELLKLNSANQLYNSQILSSSPFSPEEAKTPSSMMLFGQRGIIDGYIAANLVYDKINYHNEKIDRPLPNTLDIMYAIGNDAALQLLESDIQAFKYATNLAGLRYLVSSYDSTFWNSSYYTYWLNSIRSLNPPLDRENLPLYMQTAAWWQKSMNTQLASWSQLRHDFILYAKQPYSGNSICSFPYGYVEPVPLLYKSLNTFYNKLKSLSDKFYIGYGFDNLCENMVDATDKLYSISLKELANQPLDSDEVIFLKSTLSLPRPNCVPYLDGWYPNIFYNYNIDMDMTDTTIDVPCNYVVADVHTAPTYQQTEVGWVLHAGTAKVNLAVLSVDSPNGQKRAYIGPVMSYYETITENYQRLTDQDWETYHSLENSHRPAFTNLYLADKYGRERANQVSLYTLPTDVKDEKSISKLYLNNSPNPFNNYTLINFTVPPGFTNNLVNLTIYDIDGKLIWQLLNTQLPSNNYSIKWDGTDLFGKKVNSGVYVYNLQIGEMQESGKMMLIRD